jgi:hypothetical protein
VLAVSLHWCFWLWQVRPSTKKVEQLSTTSHPIPRVKFNVPPHPCCGSLALHFVPPPFWKARSEFHPTLALRGQLRGSPHPCQAELSYVLCLWCSDLCPPTLLDFVVPSRVVDLWLTCVDCRFIPAELDAGRLCQGERCPVHHKIVHFVSQCSTFFQEKKREKPLVAFFKADWHLGWSLYALGLPRLLCAIKSSFKGQLWNFMWTICIGNDLVA